MVAILLCYFISLFYNFSSLTGPREINTAFDNEHLCDGALAPQTNEIQTYLITRRYKTG